MKVPFFGPMISRDKVQPDLWKLHALTEMQSLLGKMNYLRKYSPVTLEVCEPLAL